MFFVDAMHFTLKWTVKGVAYPLHRELRGRQIAKLTLEQRYGHRVATLVRVVFQVASMILFGVGCIASPVTVPAYFAERKFYSQKVPPPGPVIGSGGSITPDQVPSVVKQLSSSSASSSSQNASEQSNDATGTSSSPDISPLTDKERDSFRNMRSNPDAYSSKELLDAINKSCEAQDLGILGEELPRVFQKCTKTELPSKRRIEILKIVELSPFFDYTAWNICFNALKYVDYQDYKPLLPKVNGMLHTAMLLAYADVSGEVNSLESQVEQSLKDDTNSRTLAYKDAVYSQAVLTLCKCSKFQEALSLFKRIQEYGDPLLWSALELLKGVDQNTRIEICEQCFRRYATFCGNDNNTNVCVGSNELLCILQTYLTEGKTLEDFWTFVRTLPEQKRSAVLRALCDGPQKNFSSDEQERLREIASKANV